MSTAQGYTYNAIAIPTAIAKVGNLLRTFYYPTLNNTSKHFYRPPTLKHCDVSPYTSM